MAALEPGDRRDAPPAPAGRDPAATRPGWHRLLAAPLRDLLRPARAARLLVAASRPALALALLASLLAYGLILVAVMVWTEFVPVGSPAIPAPLARWLGPRELTVLGALVCGPLLLLALAWLNLPFVHRDGPVGASFARCFRATVPVLWPLSVATALLGAGLAAVVRGEREGLPDAETEIRIARLLLAAAAALAALLVWLRCAVRGVEPDAAPADLPPRCERCGYDLTHRPAGGRCPECGLHVDVSLLPGLRRPDSAWSHAKTPGTWWTTVVEVLLRPGRFYAELRLRTPRSAEAGFAACNYVLIAAGGLAWAALMFAAMSAWYGPPTPEEWRMAVTVVSAAVVFGVVGCWAGHRAIAAAVATYWLARRSLPDFRWAAKVIVYETAFLWVFCGFWALFLTSLAVVPDWPSRLLGRGRALGLPLELPVLAAGTLGLGGVWLWRYARACRAIRWSNF